jgi:hypothetical protein
LDLTALVLALVVGLPLGLASTYFGIYRLRDPENRYPPWRAHGGLNFLMGIVQVLTKWSMQADQGSKQLSSILALGGGIVLLVGVMIAALKLTGWL